MLGGVSNFDGVRDSVALQASFSSPPSVTAARVGAVDLCLIWREYNMSDSANPDGANAPSNPATAPDSDARAVRKILWLAVALFGVFVALSLVAWWIARAHA